MRLDHESPTSEVSGLQQKWRTEPFPTGLPASPATKRKTGRLKPTLYETQKSARDWQVSYNASRT